MEKQKRIAEKITALLISEVASMQEMDEIEKVMFAEKTLRYTAKYFRKKYFITLHYAIKYNKTALAVTSIVTSIITTIILLSLRNS